MTTTNRRAAQLSPMDRAFRLLDRLQSGELPGRSLTRASAKLAALASRSKNARAIYWLSCAVHDHKLALLSESASNAARSVGDFGGAERHEILMCDHVVRRDRALKLFVSRLAPAAAW